MSQCKFDAVIVEMQRDRHTTQLWYMVLFKSLAECRGGNFKWS